MLLVSTELRKNIKARPYFATCETKFQARKPLFHLPGQLCHDPHINALCYESKDSCRYRDIGDSWCTSLNRTHSPATLQELASTEQNLNCGRGICPVLFKYWSNKKKIGMWLVRLRSSVSDTGVPTETKWIKSPGHRQLIQPEKK